MTLLDRHARPLGNLRISVTDRCNLRCAYCMPETNYEWLPRQDLLSFEEIEVLARVFVGLGTSKLRLTGGEPLLRRDLPELVRRLAGIEGVADLALTTNALMLDAQAVPLRAAGLQRMTVSLDTLDAERFRRLTRRDELDRTLRGIRAARDAGFEGTKLNTVMMRGTNDDELLHLVEFARAEDLELRFIEYMDVGGATQWSVDQVVPQDEILARLRRHYGALEPLPARGAAPAERFRMADGLIFGVIASTTQPFCGACDRSRLTADGHWFTCLYARKGRDLRGLLRSGATPEELAAYLRGGWSGRSDKGAEDRLAQSDRGRLASQAELERNPHLEMHKRGG